MNINHSTPGDGTNAVEEYVKIYMKYQDKISEFYSKDDWDGLIDYLYTALKKTRNDHWLTMQLAWAYILKKDYPKAKQKLTSALRLHDDCIMVAYLSGLVFLEEGNHQKAITLFEIVLGVSVETLVECASCPCCAEEPQAQTLHADSHFLISECYSYLGFNERARHHRAAHRKAVNEGVATGYREESEMDDEE
jgi:tetratricopeptide (TPR) repeat protein